MSLSGLSGLSGLYPPGAGVDPDAQAFITAAVLTNPVHQSAIDTLVKGFKANGTWGKYHAIYPLIGGTANSHKYNLKDPRDLDEAFRVTWSGNISHTPNGVQGDASTGYGDTQYSGVLGGMGCYTLTGGDRPDICMGRDLGSVRNLISPNWANGTYWDAVNFTNTRITTTPTWSTPGWLSFSYAPGIDLFAMRQGTVYTNGSTPSTPYFSGASIHILGSNRGVNPSYRSSRVYSFFTLSSFLTRSEAAVDYTVINTYQTALGRHV